MNAHKKRASSRNVYEAPIIYATPNKNDYDGARMHNSSIAGMYFESDRDLKPGVDICIKMVNYLPDSYGPEAYRAYLANVRWCKKIVNSDTSYYGIGAQYLIKSLVDHNITTWGKETSCALCDNNIPLGQIHETDHCVYLCPDCFKYLQAIPEGFLKESVTNFIIGNVL